MSIAKELVKGLFVKEAINEQLVIVSKKAKSGNIDYQDFNVSSNGDYSTPKTLTNEMVSYMSVNNGNNYIDVSVGADANFVCSVLECNKNINIWIADVSIINLILARKKIKDLFGYDIPDNQIIWYNTIEKYKEGLGDMKFDVITGNPPFQDSSKTEKGGTTLWSVITNHCIENLLKDGGIMSFVTPNAWMSFGKSGKIMKNYQLHTVDTDVAKFFPSVGSTFTAWTLEKTPVYKETSFPADNLYIDLREVDSLPVGRPLSGLRIINKVKSWDGDWLEPKLEQNSSLKGGWSSRKNTFLNIDASIEKTSKHKYEVFHTNSMSYYVKDEPSDYYKTKIIISVSSPYPKVYTDPMGCAFGDLRTYIVVDNEENGNNILSYLNSKLFRFVWRRPGMISWTSLKLPKLENKKWTDPEIYNFFGLTEEEIKIVDNHAG